MDPSNQRNQVFISYSHKDKQFLDELLTHLKPLERKGLVTSWSDRQIVPGSKWLTEIKNAVASSRVAVLLVSPSFLASDFIHEHELGTFLIEAEQGGVRILWVLLRACSYKETPLINYESVAPLDKPLAEMKAERDRAWVQICEEIKKAASVLSNEGAKTFPQTPIAPLSQEGEVASGTNPTFASIDKQLLRLKAEWTLNEKDAPGVFDRASDILGRLRATALDLYVEIEENQNATAAHFVTSALDHIAHLQNVPQPHPLSFNFEAYWTEGREILDLLRRALKSLDVTI